MGSIAVSLYGALGSVYRKILAQDLTVGNPNFQSSHRLCFVGITECMGFSKNLYANL